MAKLLILNDHPQDRERQQRTLGKQLATIEQVALTTEWATQELVNLSLFLSSCFEAATMGLEYLESLADSDEEATAVHSYGEEKLVSLAESLLALQHDAGTTLIEFIE